MNIYFVDKELILININRGLKFQDIALIELAMNGLICGYFFGNHKQEPFTSELLQNPYFTFELRKKIFRIIYEKKYPKVEFPWNTLQKLQELRNIIAHSRIDERTKIVNGKKTREGKPFYSIYNKKTDAESLHKEFDDHMDIIIEALDKIKQNTGIKFNKEPPIKIDC